MPIDGSTPNFGFSLPAANRLDWTDLANGNFKLIDALIATYVSVTNLTGLWANATSYSVGQNVVDDNTGVVYTAQVAHISASTPTTFLQDRTNHPTYWASFSVAARNRGAWQTATAYSLNDFVVNGSKYAVCTAAHTSGANFDTDVAAGDWSVLVDLSAAGSLVLPTLIGATDANKVVMSDTTGTAYIINTIAALTSLFSVTGAGAFVLENAPIMTNPTFNTRSPEDHSNAGATTTYADEAVRSATLRFQTFTANGTYTPNTKLIVALGGCLGAGGGGGGTGNTAVNANSGGGGGGAGSWAFKIMTPAAIGVSQSVTVGAKGTGGTAGNNAGNNGGDTSIGTLCIGKGGGGGAGSPGSAVANPGAGGIAGTGDITFPAPYGDVGTVGTWAAVSAIVAPSGASTVFGSGGKTVPAAAGAVGGNATGKGAGGGGAMASNAAGSKAGGDGSDGFAFVLELCWG